MTASAAPPRPRVGDGDGNGASPPSRGGGRRRRVLLVALAVGAAAAVGAGVWTLVDVGGDGGGETAGATATTTAEAVRRDLAETETFAGTLGFAGARRVAAGRQGTITALAPVGSIRRRGQILYRVDQRPVVLLVGAVPAWRTLADGAEGADVLQLERNLAALGHDPGTVDREFDGDTEDAVESWQESLGLEEIGVVELGDVVFSPARVRVGAHVAAVGQPAQPGGDVLEVTSATQVVTVDLEVADRGLVAVGDEVRVELPDESAVAGTVAAIGTTAEAATAETGETTATTVEVEIALPAGTDTGLDQAPVDVEVVTSERPDVLAVPVTALVALLGGGYAVEVSEGGTTRFVAVEPGLVADGYVEIAAGELAEGDSVVVPA